MIKKLLFTPTFRIFILVILFIAFIAYASVNKPTNNTKESSKTDSKVTDLKKVVVEKKVAPPKPINVNLPIDVSAKSAIIADTEGNVYFTKDLDTKLAPASTTKIMTALIAIENYNLDDVVEVPYYCTTVPTQKVGFAIDEKLTVRSLVTSMLVFSGADAACTLQYKNSEPHIFIKKMNDKALEIGMVNTNFSNVIGYDELDHYSSAEDMFKLAKYAMSNPEFARNVSLKETTIVSVDGENVHQIQNTNQLLFTHTNVLGVKTGFTDFAKDCLVFEYEQKGKRLFGIVLGSESRFEDAEKMMTATNGYFEKLLSNAGK